jgi:predicted lipid-binding transport protein (Tim44 family)
MRSFRFRAIAAMAIAALISSSFIGAADARGGGGGSFGSRGARTWSAPPTTPTAPTQARPIERSMTPQPGQAGQAGLNGARPATSPGFFSGRGLLGGLAMGFLGAGLFGMMFGGGFWGGIGSFAGFIGFFIQIILIVVVARLAWSWWQRRNQPALAGGAPPRANPLNFGLGGGLGSAAGIATGAPLSVTPDDYNAFERLLGDIQTAYSAEDLAALRQHATPEMLSYFSEELARNASRGVVNQISAVRLLKGDLAEAWREGDIDYATVAMQFALVDKVVDRATGRVVEGNDAPQTVTELWTFTRARGGHWLLGAIQQT